MQGIASYLKVFFLLVNCDSNTARPILRLAFVAGLKFVHLKSGDRNNHDPGNKNVFDETMQLFLTCMYSYLEVAEVAAEVARSLSQALGAAVLPVGDDIEPLTVVTWQT